MVIPTMQGNASLGGTFFIITSCADQRLVAKALSGLRFLSFLKGHHPARRSQLSKLGLMIPSSHTRSQPTRPPGTCPSRPLLVSCRRIICGPRPSTFTYSCSSRMRIEANALWGHWKVTPTWRSPGLCPFQDAPLESQRA